MTKKQDKRSGGVQIHGRGPRLSESALGLAQEELGAIFPADYRRFMLAHNGGKPDPPYFVRLDKWRRRTVDWVAGFCPITGSLNDPLNLRGVNDALKRFAAEGSTVPGGCIGIGYNGPDDIILMFVAGRRRSQVWLKVWDDVNPNPSVEPDPDAGMYRVASSFEEFLSKLCSRDAAEKQAGTSG